MATYNIERPFSTPFTVEINSLKVGRLLALYFGKCFLPADRIHPETIVIDEIDNTHFIIRYNQQKIITDSLLKELNIAKHIRTMARSGGTSCNICSTSCSPPSCSGCGGCSCSGSCDPIMFYFSCEGHFFVGWGKK